MARVTINMPEHYAFATEMDVRIQHINRGNHVGNDQLISFLNEARVRFLPEVISDPNLDGVAMINADLAVVYKAEAHHGDKLKVEVCADDFHKYGFDLFFRVTEVNSGKHVADAKMGMMLFDFQAKQLKLMTDEIRDTINKRFQ